jgi:hypothetical protein
MNISDIDVLQDLCVEIERKNELLKRINASYTNALACVESESFDLLAEELDNQSAIFAELSEIGAPGYESIRSQAARYVSQCGSSDPLYTILNKTAAAVDTYNRLLKNCKTLNEKLTFLVTEKKTQSQRNISALKNRRMINSGYNAEYTSAKGSIVDCVSD